MPAHAYALTDAGTVNAWALVHALAQDHLRPPRRMGVSDWAEAHRVLEKRTSAIDGPWRTYRVPHLREIMASADEPGVYAIVVMGASQIAKTEAALNWLGREIHLDPGPLMWCTSTEAQVGKLSKRRLDPMLDAPPLSELVSPRKGRDSDRTTSSIRFLNGSLTLVTANSPSSLSSDPVRGLVFDEVDRYSESSGDEGDAIALGLARQTTFRDFGALTWYISSPKLEGSSRIEQLFESGDRRRYHVPCPECGALQTLRWAQVRWDHEVPKEKAPSTAYYQCEACPARWSDADRWRAVRPESGAEWIAERPFNGIASFHASQLISTFVRLGTLVEAWLDAQGKPAQLQGFVNTVLGLPFSMDANRAPDEIALETWDGYDVPESVCLLLGFVDVQEDRLELTLCGVDAEGTLYPAHHEIIAGHVLQDDGWNQLEAWLDVRAHRSDGRSIGLTALGIDCGYEFERVCGWAAKERANAPLIYPVKAYGRGIKAPIVRERRVSKANSGRRFYVANTDAAKLNLVQRLNLTKGPGRVRFPARPCFSPRYFDQLRSEKLKLRYRKGHAVHEWHLKSGARNEALDCMAGILVVLTWLNPALDVLAVRQSRVSDEPGTLERRAHLAPAEATAEVQHARPTEAQVVAPAPPAPAKPKPEPPAAPAPRIVRVDGGGAWFDRRRR